MCPFKCSLAQCTATISRSGRSNKEERIECQMCSSAAGKEGSSSGSLSLPLYSALLWHRQCADADRGRRWREVLSEWVSEWVQQCSTTVYSTLSLSSHLSCWWTQLPQTHCLAMFLTRVPLCQVTHERELFQQQQPQPKYRLSIEVTAAVKLLSNKWWALQLETNLFRPVNYLHSLPDNFHVSFFSQSAY